MVTDGDGWTVGGRQWQTNNDGWMVVDNDYQMVMNIDRG